MSMQVLASLQKAVFLALSGSSALVARIEGIHDKVPAASPFPYLLFGAGRTEDRSTVTTRVCRVTLELHAYSQAEGRREALEIATLAQATLEGASLAPEGYAVIQLRLSEGVAIQEGDTATWRASFTMTALLQQSS